MEGAENSLGLWVHSVPCWETSPRLERITHSGQRGSAGEEREERAGLLGSHKTSEQSFHVTEEGIHVVSMFGSC